jgi:hypothetical protein
MADRCFQTAICAVAPRLTSGQIGPIRMVYNENSAPYCVYRSVHNALKPVHTVKQALEMLGTLSQSPENAPYVADFKNIILTIEKNGSASDFFYVYLNQMIDQRSCKA